MPDYIAYINRIIILLLLCLPSARAADSVPVNVTEAKIQPLIETLPLTGTFTSAQSAALSPRVSGLVAHVNVDAGDRVSAGDVLIELDTTLARLEQNRSLAELNEARVALSEAKRLRDEAIHLAKSKNIPETTVQARVADVDMKSAAVATAEAEYQQQEEILKRHSIIAPFTGVVSRKLTEAGEWVQTGTAVLDLVSIDQLRLDIQAPQEYFHLINRKTPVEVILDAVPGKKFTGNVAVTVPFNNPNARTFLVRVLVDNAQDYIIPGMSAQAIFTIELQQQALLLPRDATIQHPDGRNTVWIIKNVNGQYLASELQVQLGRTVSDSVVIKNGLKPGSLVVIRGNETLTEGQRVNILEPDNAVMN